MSRRYVAFGSNILKFIIGNKYLLMQQKSSSSMYSVFVVLPTGTGTGLKNDV